MVESLGPEATAVKAIAYHRDGKQLLTATAEALNVWGCEPAVHHDRVPVDWRQLADMHLSYKDDQPRVVGCCCNQSAVGVFLVDLRKVAPFCSTNAATEQAVNIGTGGSRHSLQQAQQTSQAQHAPPQQQGISSRGQPCQEQQQLDGYPPSSDAAMKAVAANCSSSVRQTCAEPGFCTATGARTELSAGPLSRQLNRQRTPPGLPSGGSSCLAAGADRPSEAIANTKHNVRAGGPQQMQHLQSALSPADDLPRSGGRSGDNFPVFEIRVPSGPRPSRPVADELAISRHSSSRSIGANVVGSGSRRASTYEADAPAAANKGLSTEPFQQQQQPSRYNSKNLPEAVSSGEDSKDASLSAPGDWSSIATVQETTAASIPGNPSSHTGNTGTGGSIGSGPLGLATAPAASPIIAAMAQRPLLRSELARMVTAVQLAKGFIARGNIEGAYKAVVSQGDAAVAAVVVEAVQGRHNAFELNSVESLSKLLELLLASGNEQQQGVGLSALSLVLRGPGQIVREMCMEPAPVGVDLSYEQRRNKCLLVKMALEGLGLKVGVLSRGSSSIAMRAQLVMEEFKQVIS